MSNKKNVNPTRKKKSNLNLKLITIVIAVIVVFVFASNIISTCSNNNVSAEKPIQNNEKNAEDYFTKEGELTFNTKRSEYISSIDIEIAEDDRGRTQGLMFRKEMKENQGMLFIFTREEYQSFWMRNTEISLDIIFVNSNEEIVTIHKNTETFSDNSYPSTKPAIYVVEVVGGYTSKFGINVGDKIVWRRTK
ncbi:MAG: DUF192 domain-containing protein [Ignavibacteriae bacterium]|nr:DUF192 domain-containing protein [Ignavibacteriota bacterium]NOG99029.1 DUF192 domain-containing protein [Ignavibacteriota bacterium]